MDKLGYIYRITGPSGVYIGFSTNPKSRWRAHRSRFKIIKYNSKLYAAIKKYGIENFYFDVIYVSKDIEHAHAVMEPYFIKMYDSVKNGYNIQYGGEGRIGVKLTEQQKAKIGVSSRSSWLHRPHKYHINSRFWYTISTPKFKKVTVTHLIRYCKKHGLKYKSLFESYRQGRPYKGYTVLEKFICPTV